MQVATINGQYDADNTPVAIIFESSDELLMVIEHLTSMYNGKPTMAKRAYTMYPSDIKSEEIKQIVQGFVNNFDNAQNKQ